MARYSRRRLLVRTRDRPLIPRLLVLAVALAAAPATAATPAEALTAMLAGDWEQAATLWKQLPGERAGQYRAQAREEARQPKLQAQLSVASAAVEQEDWAGADRAWQAALKLDPYTQAALDGRDKVAPYLKAHQKYADLMSREERLYDPVVRSRARQWLTDLGRHKLSDRKLEAGRKALAKALTAAETPVQLTVTSDGESEIEIFRVGQLGRVVREQLQLLPGDYVVTASRPGYRDVRATAQMRPGRAVAVDVRCTERIR